MDPHRFVIIASQGPKMIMEPQQLCNYCFPGTEQYDGTATGLQLLLSGDRAAIVIYMPV